MMSKSEADKKCMDLFGMNSDDYAKRILSAWKERTDINNPIKNGEKGAHIELSIKN